MIIPIKYKAIFLFLCGTPSLARACEAAKLILQPALAAEAVYEKMPFTSGETATYRVAYFGVLVGYGTLQVRDPIKYQGLWQRHFRAHASTGEWYRAIFKASDTVSAYSHPSNFAVSQFYINQDEGKLIGKRLQQEKWLYFDHSNCLVRESLLIKEEGVPRKETVELAPGSIDTLSVVYKLRTMTFTPGKTERLPVYSSQKNWWLEAKPLMFEKVKVTAGAYDSVKLKLQTFVGREFQQQGDVYVWIATTHPQRPILKIKGDIKLGSVVMDLFKFTPGASTEGPATPLSAPASSTKGSSNKAGGRVKAPAPPHLQSQQLPGL